MLREVKTSQVYCLKVGGVLICPLKLMVAALHKQDASNSNASAAEQQILVCKFLFYIMKLTYV